MLQQEKQSSAGMKILPVLLPTALAILIAAVSAGCMTEEKMKEPETHVQETFVAVNPDEAAVTLRVGLTPQDFSDQAKVQEWLASCQETGRADIGVYALCFCSAEGESTVYRWLIWRTDIQTPYRAEAVISKGNRYTVTVTYTADMSGSVGERGLILVTATLPAGEKPMLDLVEEDDYLGPLITYTDTDFGI